MPRPTTRTRTKKGKVARCAFCGRPLATPRLSAGSSGKLPKTAKRPERMYGGKICPTCLRELIKRSVKGLR